MLIKVKTRLIRSSHELLLLCSMKLKKLGNIDHRKTQIKSLKNIKAAKVDFQCRSEQRLEAPQNYGARAEHVHEQKVDQDPMGKKCMLKNGSCGGLCK